jgi:AbrB family looped-hinge helix DNA binding protein
LAAKKKLQDYCGELGAGDRCRIEALVTVDERGQMVLPKAVRERAKIAPADKLALITWERPGEFECLILIKAEELGGLVTDFLGPVMANTPKK